MRRIACILATILLIGSLPDLEHAEAATLDNPGFEDGGPGLGFPTALGDWGGDLTAAVTAENGITPSEQNHMLKFVATLDTGGGLTSTWCQVYQLVDVTQEAPSGETEVVATVKVNRVDGVDVDTRFFMRVLVYDGTPDTFPEQRVNGDHLVRRDAAIVADADPDTWQLITVTLTLPAPADFIAIGLFADENVIDDEEDEFAGHYADDVTLQISTPTPTEVTPWSEVKAIFR